MIQAQAGKSVLAIAPGSTTQGATEFAYVDTKDADYASWRLGMAQNTNTNPVVSLQHSDVTNQTTFVTLAADVTPNVTDADSQVVYQVDCRSKKRYQALELTPGTSANDTIVRSAACVLTRQQNWPNGTVGMTGGTTDTITVVE